MHDAMLCIVCSELIRKYREKGQECAILQEQLRECRSREVSLQQGMVGLKAEIQALLEESDALRKALATSQERIASAEAQATNSDVSVMDVTFLT